MPFLIIYRILPLYRRNAILLQILIATREVMIAKPSTSVSRQWRRMHALQYQMATCIYQRSLAASITTPKDKHQVVLVLVESLDGCIGKLLPALALMARCLVGTNGQSGVEQQYTLVCPSSQVARLWHRRTEVHLYLLEDIDE